MGRYDWCINTNEFININTIHSRLNYFSSAPAVRFLPAHFFSLASGARFFSSASAAHFIFSLHSAREVRKKTEIMPKAW
jgi:hypothetical protein